MNEVKNEWIIWNIRKSRLGRVTLLAGVSSVLASICFFGIILFLVGQYQFSNAYNTRLFFGFGVLLLAGLVTFIAGIAIKRGAEIPTDIFEPTPTAAAGPADPPQQQVIKSMFNLSLGIFAISWGILLLVLSVLIYIKATNIGSRYELVQFLLDLLRSLTVPLGFLALMTTIAIIVMAARQQNHVAVEINRGTKTISFINTITKQAKNYRLNELDGFVHFKQFFPGAKGGGTTVNVISIVFKGRRREKLSSDVYRNFAELKNELSLLPQWKLSDTLPIGFKGRRV